MIHESSHYCLGVAGNWLMWHDRESAMAYFICHVPAATISGIVVTPTQRRPQHHHIIWSFHVMSLLLLPHTTQSKQFSWMKYLQKALYIHMTCAFFLLHCKLLAQAKVSLFYISSYHHDIPLSLYPVVSVHRIVYAISIAASPKSCLLSCCFIFVSYRVLCC